MLDHFRLEVAAMGAAMTELEGLFTWQRTCPQCGRFLERADPKQTVHCPCGWLWS